MCWLPIVIYVPALAYQQGKRKLLCSLRGSLGKKKTEMVIPNEFNPNRVKSAIVCLDWSQFGNEQFENLKKTSASEPAACSHIPSECFCPFQYPLRLPMFALLKTNVGEARRA